MIVFQYTMLICHFVNCSILNDSTLIVAYRAIIAIRDTLAYLAGPSTRRNATAHNRNPNRS